MKAQIVKVINTRFYVSYKNKEYECTTSGKLKHKKIEPLVGDYCIFDEENLIIEDIVDRKNYLLRPNVANIDQALILTSVKYPDFSTNLLDKFLVICSINKIEPIICISKWDLLDNKNKKEYKSIINYYKKLGIKVLFNTNKFRIKRLFKGKVTVFTGQSGAGKSTLLNRLNKELNFEVGDISLALGRGKHTTRYNTLVDLYGGKVLDTPGFSSIDLNEFSDEDIKLSFREFLDYKCLYKDCKHINEKDCEVKKAVDKNLILKSRYDNYVKFIEKR